MLKATLIAALLMGQTAPELPEPAVPIAPRDGRTADLLRCVSDADLVLTSGHRGGPAPGYPENALETAAHTLSQGPMLIEMDVRTTRDGVLVMMHDDTLDRTTTGEGAVSDHTWAELQDLRLVDNEGNESDFRIPRLVDVIAWMRGRGVLAIDLKEDASIPAVARAVAEADAHAFTMVSTYRPAQAMLVHRSDPRITITHPVNIPEDLEVLRRVGVNMEVLTAWAGLEGYDARAPQLWAELDRQGIPVLFATLFFGDRDMEATGDYGLFEELAAQGVDIIPTDLHMEAFRTVTAPRDPASVLARCTAGRPD